MRESVSILMTMKITVLSLIFILLVSVCSHRAGSSPAENTTNGGLEKGISPTVDESFWETKEANLRKAPPVVIIRLTRYSGFSLLATTGFGQGNCKIIAHKVDFATLLQAAYSFNRQRMILPSSIPTGRFDLMLTLPDHQQEALQKAIQRQFGFFAHRETRETDTLLLKVKDPGLLALHISKQGSKMDFKHDFRQGTNSWVWSGFPMSTLSDFLETTIFLKPVVVQPDLSQRYNIAVKYDYNCDSKQLAEHVQQELSDQLASQGLELVPSRKPLEMLVVEKED